MAPQASGIGQSVRRKEDERFLRGQGVYSSDIKLPGQAYAVMVRATAAHGHIRDIDISAAISSPGVLAVYTGHDILKSGMRGIPHMLLLPPGGADIQLKNHDGSAIYTSPHVPLPLDKIRYIGEPIAVVVAETEIAARDAAEFVRVEIDHLPAVVTASSAIKPDAPQVWEPAGSNVFIDAFIGDGAATDAAFAGAEFTARISSWTPRITGVPLEPRAAIADFDKKSGMTTLRACGGFGGRMRTELAAMLGLETNEVRFILPDVGGNFGTKNHMYVEYPVLAWAARKLERPIKWVSDRQEAFLSDYQARDLTADVELALTKDGRFLGLRGSLLSNIGAHSVSFIPLMKGTSVLSGVYDIPAAGISARAVVTNVSPVSPFRSAGRPEAIWVIERLVDIAARRYGFDRIELRRKNLIGASSFPYGNPLGLVYDNGAYERVMDQALETSDWAGFPGRAKAAKARGRLRGIGLANYIEITTGVPRERARIVVHRDNRLELEIGTLPSGQGHETSFAQLLVEWLGIEIGQVSLIYGDTDRVPIGGGSHSGRSMRLGSIVIGEATDLLIAKGKRIAAFEFKCPPEAIEFRDGQYTSPSGARLNLFEVARAAAERNDLPDDLRSPFDAVSDQVVLQGAYPYGCHVCEVEIDPDTGVVDLVAFTAIDDVGLAVNPMIVHGQTHGGVAHGAGQALMERLHYASEDGQLLTGSFMDYAIPRANDLPSFKTAISEVASPTNRLGIRAGGEGGATGAPAAIGNAIADALAEYGVEHLDMPASPERVWRAIQAARQAMGR